MIRIRLFCSALIVACAVSACSPTKPAPLVDVQALRAQHQYLTALTALEQQRASNPAYLQQRQALLEAATLYQSQLLQSLRAAMDQQDYANAQKTLEAALPQLPPNAELTAFSAEFDRARMRYVQDKLDDLYQLRGEHLLKEQPLYQSLQGFTGDYDLQIAVARYQADAEYFSKLLAAAGALAMQREDYAAALKYLTTANQLHPAAEFTSAIEATTRAYDARREREKQNRTSEREQRYKKQENVLQAALAKQDFQQARIQLNALRDIGLHLAEVEQYRRNLHEAVDHYVAEQIDAGNKHYAEGHIEDALKNWNNASALQLTPELKERIEKAEKFIQRYENLKQQPVTRSR
ncbi:MAG: hypothetical protein ABW049_07115 [Spongiibacteraceae bacterium]